MGNKGKNMSHGFLMILCCLAPIILIAVLSSLNFQSSGAKNLLTALVFLACPLGHLLMMKFMSHNHKQQDKADGKVLKEKIELNS